MPRLYILETNETLGEITGEQLKFLQDNLEEEHANDRDYYVSRATLEMLKENGCDDGLVTLLEKALGDGDETEIAWA